MKRKNELISFLKNDIICSDGFMVVKIIVSKSIYFIKKLTSLALILEEGSTTNIILINYFPSGSKSVGSLYFPKTIFYYKSF